MTTTAAAPARLSDGQLAELLTLLGGTDSVELKLTVPDADHRSTAQVLDLDVLDAQLRQVYFFDTPDLALNGAGVVVRARRVQGRGEDSVVKLRPVVPDALPESLRNAPELVTEVDAMPGGFVCSASYKRRFDEPMVRDVAAGHRPVRKLFSKAQRKFFAAHAPVDWDDLVVLGPILVLKLRFNPERLGRRVVAEMWLYPDGSRILELSTKCAPRDAFLVAAETRAFLAERGVDLSAEQQTKTRTALEYFAGVRGRS